LFRNISSIFVFLYTLLKLNMKYFYLFTTLLFTFFIGCTKMQNLNYNKVDFELFTTAESQKELPTITLIKNQEDLILMYGNFISGRGKSAPLPTIDFEKNQLIILYKEQLSNYDINAIEQHKKKTTISITRERKSSVESSENVYVIIVPSLLKNINLIIH